MSGSLLSVLDSLLSKGNDAESKIVHAAHDGLADIFDNRLPDPLRRLLNPNFTKTTWEYDASHIGPDIPGNLHDKQQEILDTSAKHWWLFWGNQCGKTTLGAISLALWALGRHPQQLWEPPVTLWASALTWDLWEEILLPELLTWIPQNRIIDAPEPQRRSTKRSILVRADNGKVSRIVGKAAAQGRKLYQSARVHACWMDEEHPLSVWQEIQPRLARYGGVTIATMTPLMGLTWVYELHYEPWKRGQLKNTFCSHAGLLDNPVATKESVARLTREYQGDPSQLAARLYGHFTRPSGLAIQFDRSKHMEYWDADSIRVALRDDPKWTQYCGIDFGHWRFAFVHVAADAADRSHVLGEYFSQKEDLETRAKYIHRYLKMHWAADDTRIWGDSANQTDLFQLNKEFKRIGSPYRCVPVLPERKLRRASVTRINGLLARKSLFIRRDIGEFMKWRLRWSAATDGHQVVGSRLLWEINNWRYVAPKDIGEEAQEQDPKDNTADGADCIAALRYAIMSHYRTPKMKRPPPKLKSHNYDSGLDEMRERFIRDREREREQWM